MQSLRARPRSRCELRLPLDGRRCGIEGQGPALCRRLFGGAVGRLRAGRLADQEARGSRRRADLGRLPVRQPLLDHPGARTLSAGRQDQPVVRRRHAVQAHGAADRRQGAGLVAVQRALLLRRAARLPQDHRHDLHDRDHDHRRSRSGGPAQVLPRAAPRATRHRSAARSLHALLQERIPGALSRHDGHAPLGTGRTAGVRALHQGGLRGDLQVDRRSRHLRRHRHGLGPLRGGRHQHGVHRPRAVNGRPRAPARRPTFPARQPPRGPYFRRKQCYPSVAVITMGRHAQISHSRPRCPAARRGGLRPPRPRAGRAAAPGSRIEWEVKNRFRLFRSEADFQRHVAADRGDGVLGGRGPARARERRPRLGARHGRAAVRRPRRQAAGHPATATACAKIYLAPHDHRVGVVLAGAVPANAACAWSFDDGSGTPQQAMAPLRGRGAAARRLWPADARQRRHRAAGRHRAARGDRHRGARRADRGPGRLDRGRRRQSGPAGAACRTRASASGAFSAAVRSEYYRPGRDGFTGNKSCSSSSRRRMRAEPAPGRARARAGRAAPATARSTAIRCAPRSALAVENPPYRGHLPAARPAPAPRSTPASSAASASANARAPAPTRPARAASPAQIDELKELMAKAHAASADRNARSRPAHDRRQRHPVLRAWSPT